jgi:hypothetical protein
MPSVPYSQTPEWRIDFYGDFVQEFLELAVEVQDELLAQIELLKRFGPHLGRPRVDTLKGSRHANMKELRFSTTVGVWRFAFAFDPARKAIILCGGNKSGGSEHRFYRLLIHKADLRFDAHNSSLGAGKAATMARKGKL